MRILSNGHVGIGNSTPVHRLSVGGNAHFGTSTYYTIIDASGVQMVAPANAGTYLRLTQPGIADWSIYNEPTTGNLRVGTVAQFSTNGNVGINTTAPSSKFDVVGADNDGIVYRTSTRSVGIGQISGNSALYWGSGTDLVLFSGSERARIAANGNIGIGTITPSNKLEVNGTGYFSDNVSIVRNNTAGSLTGLTINNPGTSAAYSGINITSGTVTSQLFNDASGNAWVAGAVLRTTSNHPFVFGTNNAEQMRIAANGNVGIGNSTPTSRLFVTGDIALDGISVRDTATSTTTATTPFTLFEYPIATYDSSDIVIKAVRSGERHTTKLLVTANSTVAIATEYGILTTGSVLYTVDVDITGANTRVRITPTSTTSTVFKASYELITA